MPYSSKGTIVKTFAHVYKHLLQTLIKKHPAPHVLPHVYEILNASLTWDASKISIYSDRSSVTFPIMFSLSEFCWTLSSHLDTHRFLKPLTSKALSHILSSKSSMYLLTHVPQEIAKLLASRNTYQSKFYLFQMSDIIHLMPEFPRTAEVQFIMRDDVLNMIINTQSSDIISSLPIDAFQWHVMFKLFLNELNETSPNEIKPGQIFYNIGSLYMTKEDYPKYNSFEFPCYKFEHFIEVYQSYSNVHLRSTKRFSDARTLSHLLDILDIGTSNKITKMQRIFKKRKIRMGWDEF